MALSTRRTLVIDSWHTLLFAYTVIIGVRLVAVVPSNKIWLLYAAWILPCSWRRLPELWRTVAVSRLFRLALIYLGFLLASMFWSPKIEPKAVLSTLVSAITIAHFLLLTAGFRIRYPEAFDRQLGWLCCLAAASAVAIIAVWYSHHPFPQSRMQGLGHLANPIRGASVLGVFAVIAWHKMIQAACPNKRISFGLAFAAIFVYACLSWTRSVLLAIVASQLALTVMQLKRKALLPLGLMGSTGLVLAMLLPELTPQLMRPEPYRPYIWMDALARALQHPWFGQGYFADQSGVTRLADGTLFPYDHPHSFFIANLLTGGLTGFGLAAWLVGHSLYQAWKIGAAHRDLLPGALLIYSLLCISPNGIELLSGLKIKASWLIFWLPLGLAIGLASRPTTQAQPTSPASCEAPDSDPESKKR